MLPHRLPRTPPGLSCFSPRLVPVLSTRSWMGSGCRCLRLRACLPGQSSSSYPSTNTGGSCSCECPKMKQKTHRAPSCLKRGASGLCEGPRKAAAVLRLTETPARAWRRGRCTFCRGCSLQKAVMLMSPVGEGHQGMPESVPRGALRSCQHRGAVQASDKRCSAQKAGSRAPSG